MADDYWQGLKWRELPETETVKHGQLATSIEFSVHGRIIEFWRSRPGLIVQIGQPLGVHMDAEQAIKLRDWLTERIEEGIE